MYFAVCRLAGQILLCLPLSWFLLPSAACGQFTTILNIPPEPDIGDNQSIGADTQLNLSAGGSIGDSFNAKNRSEVNISGGSVGSDFRADGGSQVNISGGSVGESLDAGSGSIVNISGGTIGNLFRTGGGGSETLVNISGGFIGDNFRAFNNSTVNISGGTIGSVINPNVFNPFQASAGSEVVVSDGSISRFQANDGSLVNISGGMLGDYFTANGGSEVNISGGSFGAGFRTVLFSEVSISGGDFYLDGTPISGLETVGDSLVLEVPANSVLSGVLTDGTPFAFSSLDIDHLNGSLELRVTPLPAITPAVIMVPASPVPLGIRENQTLVVKDNGIVGDNFNATRGSIVVVAGGQVGHNFEAVGTNVTISDGSVGNNFGAFANSLVSISGGTVGDSFVATSGSTVNISGGEIGSNFDAFSGSKVHVSGGTAGNDFNANEGSEVNISGGSFGNRLETFAGSTVNIAGGSVGGQLSALGTVNISGGSIGVLFQAYSGSEVNISGGSIGNSFNAFSGSTVNLLGVQFIVDGLDITDSLSENTPFTLSDNDVSLEGILADGSPFSFNVETSNFFHRDALLTLTLVWPGDFNGDGEVSGADFLKWQRGESPNPLSQSDLADWEANYGNVASPIAAVSTAAVPEPTTSALTLAALCLAMGRRRSH